MKLGTRELSRPKKLYNIDNTTNKAGNVTHYVNLVVEIAGKKKEMRFLVSNRTRRCDTGLPMVLRHGRDVHPTWVKGHVPCVILTSMRVWFVRDLGLKRA